MVRQPWAARHRERENNESGSASVGCGPDGAVRGCRRPAEERCPRCHAGAQVRPPSTRNCAPTLEQRLAEHRQGGRCQPHAAASCTKYGSGRPFYSAPRATYLLVKRSHARYAPKRTSPRRLEKLAGDRLDQLPLKDASPSCAATASASSRCSRTELRLLQALQEESLQKVENVTVYIFCTRPRPRLHRQVPRPLCAKDKVSVLAGLDAEEHASSEGRRRLRRDAIDRNLEFGKKHKITGRPR